MKDIIISLDLEDFSNDFGRSFGCNHIRNTFDSIEKAVSRLESLLERCGQIPEFTIFVTGDFVERYPDYVNRLSRKHEISSHLYHHENVSSLDKDNFENQVVESSNLIKKITGFKPPGYRSPNFKIINKTYDSLQILGKYFSYDSSQIYSLNNENNNFSKYILEVPIPSIKIFGFNYKILGGTFLKICPIFFIDFLFSRSFKQNIRPQVYIHPYELIFGFDFLFNPFNITNTSIIKKLLLLIRQLQWVGPINLIFYLKLLYILCNYKHIGRIDKSFSMGKL